MKTPHENVPLYLDHAATTRIDPEVAAAMSACFATRADYGNAASSHIAGRCAQAAIDTARQQLGRLLNARPEDLIWTSGATEADNLAIIGAARFRSYRGRHLITMTTEHKAVLESFDALEKEGFEVTRLSPGDDGVLAIGAGHVVTGPLVVDFNGVFARRACELNAHARKVVGESRVVNRPRVPCILRARDALSGVNAAIAALPSEPMTQVMGRV